LRGVAFGGRVGALCIIVHGMRGWSGYADLFYIERDVLSGGCGCAGSVDDEHGGF
jgi:hypothetical protein